MAVLVLTVWLVAGSGARMGVAPSEAKAPVPPTEPTATIGAQFAAAEPVRAVPVGRMPRWSPPLLRPEASGADGGEKDAAAEGFDVAEMAGPHEGPPLSRVYVPAGPKRVSPGAIVRRGPFVSVQVNVDEHGMNILGDAANEPSIAIDPTNPDRMAIGWRQFDTVESDFRQAGFAYTDDGGKTWTFPGVLTPGTFRSDPVLDADAEGNFYYYNIRSHLPDHGDIFRSTDGGRTWFGPFFAYGGDKPWMIVDRSLGQGRGNVYAAWPGRFARSWNGGQAFEEPVGGLSAGGSLCVTADGAVYTITNSSDAFGAGVYRSTNASDPETPPLFEKMAYAPLGGYSSGGGGANPRGLGHSWIDVDLSDGPFRDSLYALGSVQTGLHMEVHLARSVDGGETWEGPIRVNDDPVTNRASQWFAAMSVSEQTGRIDVVWNDGRTALNDNEFELYYAYSTDGGRTFSRNMPFGPMFDSHVGWPVQRKIGEYNHMRSDEKGGRLAYAATYNGEQDIYYVHTVLDCNENGLHDGDDVALNRSPDADENGIPDDCPCNPLTWFDVDCDGGLITAQVQSSFPEGTELTLFDNGEPVRFPVNQRGRARVKKVYSEPGYHAVDLDGCATWGRTVKCGYPCGAIKRFRTACRNLRLTVRVKTLLPEGYRMTIRRGEGGRTFEVDANGRIRWSWTYNNPREVPIGVEECPEFDRIVTCE